MEKTKKISSQNNPLSPGSQTSHCSPIQKRIQSWKEKKVQNETGVKLTVSSHQGKENVFNVKQELNNNINPNFFLCHR